MYRDMQGSSLTVRVTVSEISAILTRCGHVGFQAPTNLPLEYQEVL